MRLTTAIPHTTVALIGLALALVVMAPAASAADTTITGNQWVVGKQCVGVRCNPAVAPPLDLVIASGNTPAIRFDQDTSSGTYAAQAWDIGANEANFFVRDVTGGSMLPFRIRPGAPTSSIDIAASGVVSFGSGLTTSGAVTTGALTASSLTSPGTVTASALAAGSLTTTGTILSDVASQRALTNTTAVASTDGAVTLDALRALPFQRYRSTGEAPGTAHLSPTYASFRSAFGLGSTDAQLAPSDVAATALLAVQALDARVSSIALTPGAPGSTGPAGPAGAAGAAGTPGSAGVPSAATTTQLAAATRRIKALTAQNARMQRSIATLQRQMKVALRP